MRRKQLSFDIDTKVAKAILGKNNYIKAYLDVRKFLEKEGWEHIIILIPAVKYDIK